MTQIKIFKGIESDSSHLEKSVNHWLAENKVRVVQIFGNIAPQSSSTAPGAASIGKTPFSPSDILLVVLYETAE